MLRAGVWALVSLFASPVASTWVICVSVSVQVKIMKPYDPKGVNGPKTPLPDVVKVMEPKVRACVLVYVILAGPVGRWLGQYRTGMWC